MKSRITLTALLLGLVAFGNGCDGGREGDRCNPNLSHNDCDDGLACVQPATCVESYCCPSSGGASSNRFCNGQSCPAPDAAGAEDSGPDAREGAGPDAASDGGAGG